MTGDEEVYRIIPSEEELRREAMNKLVECSIIKDRINEMNSTIEDLNYLLRLLDDTTPTKDANGRVDIRPVYREIRRRIMAIMCEQKEMEERILSIKSELGDTDHISNMKVIVKRL